MPAFTATEIRRCHEIAQIIIADTAKIHNGFGIVLELSNLTELKNALQTVLTNMDSSDTDSRTEVQALIVLWNKVRSKTADIQGGSAGNISGVSYSFEGARARIKELFQVYVPVMHIADSIRRRANQSIAVKSVNVGISRL